MLTLTELKYLQTDKQQGYKNYSLLVSTSLNNSRVNDDVGTFVVVPLTSEDLIQALGKIGFSSTRAYKSMNNLNLVRLFFRVLQQNVPCNNSVEMLTTFTKTYMQPCLIEGTELWGVQDLDAKLDQGDRKFL